MYNVTEGENYTMNRLQECLLETLIEFDRVCKLLDIEYSLAYGTLIGAIRHNGFIPWDDDIDIILDRENYNRLLENGSLYFGDNYFIECHETNPNYLHSFAKLRNKKYRYLESNMGHVDVDDSLWIDLFPFDAVPDSNADRLNHYKVTNKISKTINRLVFTRPLPYDKGIRKFLKTIIYTVNRTFGKLYFFLPKKYTKRESIITMYNSQDTEMLCNVGFPKQDFNDYLADCINRSSFESYIDWEFEGRKFKVFTDYDLILTNRYGDYMTLPDESERINPHPAEIIDL